MDTQKIEKREYQQVSAQTIIKWFKNHKTALMVMATGLGKMITAAIITKKIGGRGIFLVHDNGILDHAMKEFRRVYGHGYSFGLFNGHEKSKGDVDILFATFQTMKNHAKSFSRGHFSWMVVDESHHAQARTYRKTIERFTCRKLAITATPNRVDLLDIRAIFGEEVVNIPLEEAIVKGWLPSIEYHLITDNVDDQVLNTLSRKVLDEGERVSVKEINSKIFISSREKKVARIIKRHGNKAVVFCRNIRHANYFRQFFGKTADTYHSGQSREKNQDVLTALKDGGLHQVLAVNAFNEGIHVPDVDVVVFYRDTKSETVFRQQLGRGLHPGASKLIVLDFVGNIQRVNMINNLAKAIEERARKKYPKGYKKRSFQIKGKGFNFLFSDQAINLLKIMERVNVDFYPTWQEAGRAAQALGIKSAREYKSLYHKDMRLPSNPNGIYQDFPGWQKFLGSISADYYGTWQQARLAVLGLGQITSLKDYRSKYKKDSRLHSRPDILYGDFPGYNVYLGLKYATVLESSVAAKKLGAKTRREYEKRYKGDPKLYIDPHRRYPNFPGWQKFLGK